MSIYIADIGYAIIVSLFQFLGFDRFGVWILHLFPHACVLEVQRRRRVGEWSGRRFLTVYTRRLDANARLIYGHRSAPPACMCATNGEFFMRFGGAASAVVARGRPRAPYQLKVILVSLSLSLGRGPFRKKLSPVQYCSLTDCRLAGWMAGRILHVFI
jgi:hypothetical protein